MVLEVNSSSTTAKRFPAIAQKTHRDQSVMRRQASIDASFAIGITAATLAKVSVDALGPCAHGSSDRLCSANMAIYADHQRGISSRPKVAIGKDNYLIVI